MASPSHQASEDPPAPQIRFTSPSFGLGRRASGVSASEDTAFRRHRRPTSREAQEDTQEDTRHVHLPLPTGGPKSPSSSARAGSDTGNAGRSRSSLRYPAGSAPGSSRVSMSNSRENLLQDINPDLDNYGTEELRDGFFAASFFKPAKVNHEDLMREAEITLPVAFNKRHPLSPKHFLPKQWEDIKRVVQVVCTTRAGIMLTKSFLAFFIAYILCLVPAVRSWLGRYSFIMVLSTILNHPGRAIGAQIDGAILTIVGTATGLGWGAFALWLSHSSHAAMQGNGAIMTTFLVIFIGIIAVIRSYYLRMYQLIICAGISVLYTCLADTSQQIRWGKLYDYGIPWLFGQAIALLVCCTVFPDAGARPLAVALHDAFDIMQQGLALPQPETRFLHRRLAYTFVNLSQAYRDLTLDISFTRFQPSDVMALRNLMQAVIRSQLSLKLQTQLFNDFEEQERDFSAKVQNSPQKSYPGSLIVDHESPPVSPTRPGPDLGQSSQAETVIDIDPAKPPSLWRTDSQEGAVKLVARKLADPTSKLISCMRMSLTRCDAVLMGMSGYRKYLGPPRSVSNDILGSLTKLRKAMIKYDENEDSLLKDPALPPTYSNHPEVVELFLFVHPIRQAAITVEALTVKVNEMQQRRPGWRLYLPSYPWAKALQRTNAQVRHDRGGVTAGFYFRSQTMLARTMKGMASIYKPLPRDRNHNSKESSDESDTEERMMRTATIGKYEEEKAQPTKKKRMRYRLWLVLHRLQGFETKFALKAIIVISLLATPAWLSSSRGWWNANEIWWAVVMAWIMLHPRVGGNIQDLFTRAFCVVLGAVWGGLAYAAYDGNPYIMALFAFVYMLPMIYRYTQSSHPRSGIVGCISFVVVSMDVVATEGQTSPAQVAWTRGVAFVVGVVAAVIVNWMLWPFVARHELRKALSSMMVYSSIIYRSVVAKYVYYEKGEAPGKDDIERSEMLEGRLREGFVRIRQLMALTRHEIRLRGPFNPLPYSALIDACEQFFEYLVSVRQSSLFFHPDYLSDNDESAGTLLTRRRDAVAAILMNLYILAGALREPKKVPRYLPSASSARRRLLEHMAEIEQAQADTANLSPSNTDTEKKKWSQVYLYSYSQSLTGCVQQLEQLQRYTKEICGELGFDPIDPWSDEDRSQEPTHSNGVLNGK